MDENCVCCEYDGLGYSCCGDSCPAHPPDGSCPDCGISIHANQVCLSCRNKRWKKELEEALADCPEIIRDHVQSLNSGIDLYIGRYERQRLRYAQQQEQLKQQQKQNIFLLLYNLFSAGKS